MPDYRLAWTICSFVPLLLLDVWCRSLALYTYCMLWQYKESKQTSVLSFTQWCLFSIRRPAIVLKPQEYTQVGQHSVRCLHCEMWFLCSHSPENCLLHQHPVKDTFDTFFHGKCFLHSRNKNYNQCTDSQVQTRHVLHPRQNNQSYSAQFLEKSRDS